MQTQNIVFRPSFNSSVEVEARSERLTNTPGAVLLREMLDKLGILPWLEARLSDPRDPERITYPLSELLRTRVLLLALGYADQDDADFLRDDPSLLVSVSDRRGLGPLLSGRVEGSPSREKNPPVPQHLASQPTMSRLVDMLSPEPQRAVLREGLLESAARRNELMRGARMRYITVDIDSFPIEVHGHQPGSAYNGHYGTRIYHPLIATLGETGDLLDLTLREGAVHTAQGAGEFILPLLSRVEETLGQVAAVRIDAGFPEEELLSALEGRRTPYVARLRNNPALDRMAEPHLRRPPGRRPASERSWTVEMSYQAQSWSRPRRVVLVVLDRPGELFLHFFWLVTNWTAEQVSGEELLSTYRERGSAEGFTGELVNVMGPVLSATARPKSHYRGASIEAPTLPADGFAHNEVTLLLCGLAYNLMHAARMLAEAETGAGMSLKTFRQRVLTVASRVVLHARRATLVIGDMAAWLWRRLGARLTRLRPVDT
jgi:hypothetical protein